MLMARSVRYQFFLTPDESVNVVSTAVDSLELNIYLQLRKPGVVLENIKDAAEAVLRPERPPRLLLSRRPLKAGSELGTDAGAGWESLVLVSLPFIEENRFYLGEVGAKYEDEHEPNAVAARALVRMLRRRAPVKLLARNIPYDVSVPASGLGASKAALELTRVKALELRQFGVENGDFIPPTA